MSLTQPRMRTGTFTVPVTGGNYAPEVLYLNRSNEADTAKALDELAEVGVLVEALPATATVEFDLLQPNGDPTVAGDWITAVVAYTTTGLQSLLALARWCGGRIRVKSGGTAGTATVHASWW